MTDTKTFAAAAFLSMMAAPAMAQNSGFYAGLGASYQGFNFDEARIGLGAIQARAGYGINDYLAVETEAALGVSDHDFTRVISGVTYDLSLKMNHSVGAFAVARLPVADNVRLFARGGYTASKYSLKGTANGQFASESASDDGVSFGGGGEFSWGRSGLRADYTRNAARIGEGRRVGVFSLSLTRRF